MCSKPKAPNLKIPQAPTGIADAPSPLVFGDAGDRLRGRTNSPSSGAGLFEIPLGVPSASPLYTALGFKPQPGPSAMSTPATPRKRPAATAPSGAGAALAFENDSIQWKAPPLA